MKRTIILLAALAFVGTTVSAQFIKFGVKTGVNFSKLKFDEIRNMDVGDIEYRLSEDDNITGFHIGVMSRIKIFAAYLQPELYFNTSGGRVLLEGFSEAPTTEDVMRIKYNKIDMPLLVGGKLTFLRLNAGPVASVILSTNSEISDIIPGMKTLSKNASLGFQAGAGFDLFKTLTFDFRYEAGLSKVGDKFTLGNQDFAFDSRSRKFMFSVGFLF